jgi:hypothetical protein
VHSGPDGSRDIGGGIGRVVQQDHLIDRAGSISGMSASSIGPIVATSLRAGPQGTRHGRSAQANESGLAGRGSYHAIFS